jgi:hypothetical protein
MKRPPFPTKEDVVAGWIDLQLAAENSPEWEESFWSHMLVDDLVNDFPRDAFDLVLSILESNQSDSVKGAVAAGPVEDLLVQHGSEFIDLVEQEAKRSPKFGSMLGGVWRSSMDEDIWLRLTAVWDRRGWDGIPLEIQQAEQAGADQPATAPESKAE